MNNPDCFGRKPKGYNCACEQCLLAHKCDMKTWNMGK